MSFTNRMLIGAKIRLHWLGEDIRDFMKNEQGVSNVVATVILVLIVVLLIGVFWTRIKEWLSGMIERITSSTFTDDGL